MSRFHYARLSRVQLVLVALVVAFAMLFCRYSPAEADENYKLGYVWNLQDGNLGTEANLNSLNTDLAQAKNAGATWVRYSASWCNQQPQSPRSGYPTWNQTLIDRAHELITRAHDRGLKVLLQFGGSTPPWAVADSTPAPSPPPAGSDPNVLISHCASATPNPRLMFPPTNSADSWRGSYTPERSINHTADLQSWVRKLLITSDPPDAVGVWNEVNYKLFGRNPNNPSVGMPPNLYSTRIFEPVLKAVRGISGTVGDLPVIAPSASGEGPSLVPFVSNFVQTAIANLESYDASHSGEDIAHTWNLGVHLYPLLHANSENNPTGTDLTQQGEQLKTAFYQGLQMAKTNGLADGKVWVDEWGINGKVEPTLTFGTYTASLPALGQTAQANQLVDTFCELAPNAGPMIRYSTAEVWPAGGILQTQNNHTTDWGYGALEWVPNPNSPGQLMMAKTASHDALKNAAANPATYC